MYSYELLYAYTGDNKWAERLEVVAFNALPATISDDMWCHQYVQMSNQIACERFPGRSLFRTNNAEAHLFGLEPYFGCCTANFNQGWPKFTLSAYLHQGDAVLNAIMLPSELNDNGKHIKLETNYPFENSFKYTVSTDKDFNLTVRVPSFAKDLTVDGKAVETGDLKFTFKANEHKEINISFTSTPYIEKRPLGLNVAKCGSLLFALPIKYEKNMLEYERNGIERKFPYCDYEYIPKESWNYGFARDELKIEQRSVSDIPFSSENPPITLKATVCEIDWGFEDGYDTVCAKVPESREAVSGEEELLLFPYGCAKLRMTELPKI